MKVYAFDVDLTLDCAGGPIPISQLYLLSAQRHIIGICGNWPVFVHAVPDWQFLVSFIGPMGVSKGNMLTMISTFMRADEYILVGNAPQDLDAAKAAGWTFISENDFMGGKIC